MELILVRHGRANERDASRWADDSDRPLMKEGVRELRQMASHLPKCIPTPGLVLASRFARTWKTAEVLSEDAGWPAPTAAKLLEAEMADDPAEYLAILRHHHQVECLALVGHQPHMGDFADYLLGATRGTINFRKAAVAHFRITLEATPPHALLKSLLHPAMFD